MMHATECFLVQKKTGKQQSNTKIYVQGCTWLLFVDLEKINALNCPFM